MATWIGVARTNYFRVKDVDAFKKEMEGFSGVRVVEGRVPDKPPHFALFGEEGYWPNWRYTSDDVEAGEEEEVYFPDVIAPHLPDDEVAVFMSAGFEKERYVTGDAFAINSKGEELYVSINDIYKRALDAWGIRPTAAEY